MSDNEFASIDDEENRDVREMTVDMGDDKSADVIDMLDELWDDGEQGPVIKRDGERR